MRKEVVLLLSGIVFHFQWAGKGTGTCFAGKDRDFVGAVNMLHNQHEAQRCTR
jgi:hypothetical protein